MQTLRIIAGVLILFSLLWGLLGLIRPRVVLWWALPAKQTKWRALFFAFLCALMFFCLSIAIHSDTPRWFWLVFMLSGGAISATREFFSKDATNATEDLFSKKKEKEYKDMSTEEKRRFNASLSPEELAARAHASVQRKQQADAENFKKAQAEFKKIKKLQEEVASLFDDPLWDAEEEEECNAKTQWREDHDWKFNWERELRILVSRPLSEVEISALKKRFGGDEECLYNLRMYAARITKGETMCIVPADAHLRPRFEVLRKGGLAEVYKRFMPELLDVLTLPQLRLVGKSAGLDKLGRDKASSCALLRVLPEKTLALAWTATEIDFHDVYHLKMIN